MSPAEALSPLDGRYHKITKVLASYFSEQALMRYRMMVEAEYLIYLSAERKTALRRFSSAETELLRNIYRRWTTADAKLVSRIEREGYEGLPATNHDVKAAEYFLKKRLAPSTLADALEWIHFGLTSEDVNSLAYGLLLSDAIDAVLRPKLMEIRQTLEEFAERYSDLPMLSRTHGQPASPSTFGKEFKVFAARLFREAAKLKNQRLWVKLGGATGNFNAHYAAYPKVDWLKFAAKFVQSLNRGRAWPLSYNPFTTQVEPHDGLADLFDNLRRINVILIDFDQDMWRYISDSWIVERPVAGEIGSSTMPHKVNPIAFENSEGNLGLANSLFGYFSAKLPISRLQRDLSDSTVKRNFGAALGHSLIGYHYLLSGLAKITVNEQKVKNALEEHPEVIAEAIQTVLRREGVSLSYEKLKILTRGRSVTRREIEEFIESLEVTESVKKELREISPFRYTGIAGRIAKLPFKEF